MDLFKEAQFNHTKPPLKGCKCSYCTKNTKWKSRNGNNPDKRLNRMARAKVKSITLKEIKNNI